MHRQRNVVCVCKLCLKYRHKTCFKVEIEECLGIQQRREGLFEKKDSIKSNFS